MIGQWSFFCWIGLDEALWLWPLKSRSRSCQGHVGQKLPKFALNDKRLRSRWVWRSCIRLRILRFGRAKFFRNNRSHARNSLACDMPLFVPYRIRYRLSVRAEKSKIKFVFLPLGGVKCKAQINFFQTLIVVVSR